MLKLDLGAGPKSPEGFTPLGNINGTAIFPLPHAGGSVDEIRASHVLEHFAHGQVMEVLADWVRALKPGGVLKVAVPDFEKITEAYKAGRELPIENYVMGGQVDNADYHKALFDTDCLKRALAEAGLVLLRPWQSELKHDGASLPISLNLAGTKPKIAQPMVRGVMSIPRLGFNDMWNCAVLALPKLGIEFSSVQGAFWEQCLTLALERALEEGADYLLTVDYDSVFHAGHVAKLIQLAMVNPEVDAICPLQSSRHFATPMFGLNEGEILAREGETVKVERDAFEADLKPVPQAHFGLTLINAGKLSTLPQPWFHGTPNAKGEWKSGKVDPDIAFWRKWKANGRTLCLAPRVVIGHLELMVRWPDQEMQPLMQPAKDWERTRQPPPNVWTGEVP